MGMCLGLHSVSDKNIERILASPPLIWRLLAADDPDIYLDEVKESMDVGFLSRIFSRKPDSGAGDVPDLEFVDGENVDDDLDKSWHGIHYCLNKTDYDAEPPMDFIIVGGKIVGDVDMGYGPARLLTSKEVKEIGEIISNISSEQLRENYNPSEMTRLDIYPAVWEEDGEDGFEYISEYFDNLKKFVASCSRHNLGMAVYLC